jgi:hypothetical protein
MKHHPGDLFTYKENTYIFVGYGKMKVSGNWVPAILYSGNGVYFAREQKDFESKFTLLF